MPETKSNPSTTQTIPNKHILKTSSCKALSGNGTIGYELSLDSKKALHIRIVSNTGGGYFSNEPIAMSEVEGILFSLADDERLTSTALQPLFRGKSINNLAFLMTILRNEGFVKPIGELKRYHQCIDAKSFKALIRKLQKLTISSTIRP